MATPLGVTTSLASVNLMRFLGHRSSPLLGRKSLSLLGSAVLAMVLLTIGMTASPVAAVDNTLVSSLPEAGSTLEISPTSIQLTFATSLGQTNSVTMTCGGTVVGLGSPTLSGDALQLTVAVPTALPNGTCTVGWLVSNPDATSGGSGDFEFSVNSAVPATLPPTDDTTPGSAPTETTAPAVSSGGDASDSDTSNGPVALFRLIATIGLAVLFGALVLIVVAWPEGVEYILTVRFLRYAWIIATAGTYLFAAATAAQIDGTGLGSALIPTGWGSLADTAPGLAALVRFALTAAAGWVVLRPERVIDPSTQLPALAIPGLAVATIGFARAGGDLAIVGYATGAVHALAMAVWLGGLVLLARVVLAGPGEEDLVHAVRGFDRLSMPAIIVTVITGAILTQRTAGGALFSTGHGRVLLLKAVAVGAMVFVGLASRQFIKTRLARTNEMTVPMAVRLRRAVGVEAAAGILVLALTAWMLSFSPGNLSAADSTIRGLGDAQIINDPSLPAEVRVSFSQVVGPNAVRVEVVEPESGLIGLTVTFTPPPDAAADIVILSVPLTTDGVAFLPLEQGIPLAAPGTWQLTVTINGVVVGSKNVTVSLP